jgi:hypothetical protein
MLLAAPIIHRSSDDDDAESTSLSTEKPQDRVDMIQYVQEELRKKYNEDPANIQRQWLVDMVNLIVPYIPDAWEQIDKKMRALK